MLHSPSHELLFMLFHGALCNLKSFVVDDGAFYFDEKLVDAHEHQGPLSTTSSVVRGLTAFAAVTSGSLNVSKVCRCCWSLFW